MISPHYLERYPHFSSTIWISSKEDPQISNFNLFVNIILNRPNPSTYTRLLTNYPLSEQTIGKPSMALLFCHSNNYPVTLPNILGKTILTFRWNRVAVGKRVSCKPWYTHAGGQMIYDLTVSVLTARSRTRILAFVVNACSVSGAIRAQDAFGTTPFVGISYVLVSASTGARAVLFPTQGVCATGRRDARCQSLRLDDNRLCYKNNVLIFWTIEKTLSYFGSSKTDHPHILTGTRSWVYD